jgi:hypothetical protein
MGSVTQKKTKGQKQKSKRMKALNEQRQKKKIRWASSKKNKKLTEEQKKTRTERLIENKKTKKIKEQSKLDKVESQNIKTLQNALLSVFNPEILDRLAKTTGFIKRSGGQITAFSFIYILSFGFFGNGEIALIYLTAGLGRNFMIFVTPQALSKRINSRSGVDFIKETLQALMQAQLKVGLKNKFSKTFHMFTRINLEDSSQVSLNEMLTPHYMGSGGGASKSSIKINFIYDIANICVLGIKITSGIVADRANALEILKYATLGSLNIRDLGFFIISALKKMETKGAFYLSRLSFSTHIYLNKNDEQPLNIPAFLEKQTKNGNKSVSLDVYVGKDERFKTRLVAELVPKTVLKQREARYRKENKKEPSEYYTEWSGFSIFITNIPKTMFSGEMIISLYKIRWQIELTFKNFKSNIDLDILKGTNKHRIESLVYGRLITIVTIFIIHNYAAHVAQDREVSEDKLTKWLDSDKCLKEAIIKNSLLELLIQLEFDIEIISKQKRTRKTTLDILEAQMQQEISNNEYQLLTICA